MSIVVVGSVAFDTLQTPYGKREKILGGAATYFSLSASYFTDVRVVAVSPDGKWVATSSHDTNHGVRIWEAATGRLVQSVEIGRISAVAFSPDGRWLFIGGDKGRLMKVGSWKEQWSVGPTFFYTVCFSPDGRILAMETGEGEIQLLDVDSGRELARLAAPDQDRVFSLSLIHI